MVTHTGGPEGLKWKLGFPSYFFTGKEDLSSLGLGVRNEKRKKREWDWDLGQNQASQWDLGKRLAWICDLKPPLSSTLLA